MTKLHDLAQLGQSIWLDYIRRSFISTGELHKLIDLGLRGMTSNPSIFEKAIGGSQDYASDLQRLTAEGRTAQEIYGALVIDDIRAAADLLQPVYEATQGADGYVSLEVNPTLANDTQATFDEAQRLWTQVGRPNLMIKIPATLAGLPAITRALMAGINVNVTLIFSLDRYAAVMEAFLRGLEERARVDLPVERLASVASFFVSRVDKKVDQLLETIIAEGGERAERARLLLGKAAVANAKMAYSQFRAVSEGDRFKLLEAKGARFQRPLWASTSTKNPAYSDIKYVQELIGPQTVNTLPMETIEAILDHGEPRLTLEEDLETARTDLVALADLGISMEQVTQELEEEGVAAFAASFEKLMNSLAGQREALRVKQPDVARAFDAPVTPADIQVQYSDGLEASANRALVEMAAQNVINRIWDLDRTLWKPDSKEVTNRMGWLRSPEAMRSQISEIESLVKAVRADACTNVLLLGMGGSSLAPQMFARTFAGTAGSKALELDVLDSTDPAAVLAYMERLDPFRTLYIVSTKSGTTEETLSLFRYFYNRVLAAVGKEEAGDHFVAITDPGSHLADLAEQYHFRKVILNDPNIGGRYSALSHFGLVPAALAGVDLRRLLDSAEAMSAACRADRIPQDHPAARLGAVLSTQAREGRDKLTLILSPAISNFGSWVEQLLAESTGKEGNGILPVVGEPLGPPEVYGDDRLFVHLRLDGDANQEAALDRHEAAGFPVIRILLKDPYDLGGQLFLWEMATAIAGYRLRINPFDQPNVEAAKLAARAMMAAYEEKGSLPETEPDVFQDGIAVYLLPGSGIQAATPGEALRASLYMVEPGGYIALQAFLPPSPDIEAALQELRLRLRERTRAATTVGFGPRFLHSTGQLHKGDAGKGLFIQFTSEPEQDLEIPQTGDARDSNRTFGVLIQAQALGDRQTLLEAGRRVLSFHLAGNPAQKIHLLAQALE